MKFVYRCINIISWVCVYISVCQSSCYCIYISGCWPYFRIKCSIGIAIVGGGKNQVTLRNLRRSSIAFSVINSLTLLKFCCQSWMHLCLCNISAFSLISPLIPEVFGPISCKCEDLCILDRTNTFFSFIYVCPI